MEKKWYPQMDGLRTAAAAAVVMIHVSAGSAGGAAQVCNQLARFAVPLFILLSAFGHGAPGQNLMQPAPLFLRRMKRILPPFWLWSALYLSLDALFGRPHTAPLWDLVSGGAYMHLYFIVVLAQFELLYVPLYRAVERAPYQTLLLSGLITLVMQALLCGAQLGLCRLPALPVPYSSLFVPYLLFYTVGLWLRRRDALPVSGSGKRLVCIGLLWLVSAAAVLWTVRRFPTLGSLSLRPDLTVYVFTSGLLLWELGSMVRQMPRPVRRLSELSFALYLSHSLVMRLWNEWTVRQEPVIYLRLWQSWLMTFAGGLLIAGLVSCLPHGSLLGGAPHRKSNKITEGKHGEKTRNKSI